MSEQVDGLQDYMQEVDGYTSAFFLRLETKKELVFGEGHKEDIFRNATLALGKHMTEYGIKARTIDAFKLVGNLGYFAALNVQSRVIAPNARGNSVRETCLECVEHLYSLGLEEVKALKDEGKVHREANLTLPRCEIDYLAEMLFNEVCKKGDIGIGANGVGAVFSFMIKALKYETDSC